MKRISLSSLAVLFGCLCATVAGAQTWNHNPNSPIGPLNWGDVTHEFGTCGEKIAGSFAEVGKRQTPVAIEGAQTIAIPRLIFNYKATPLEVENTGHVVEVPYQEGSSLRVDGSSSPADLFQVQQFHFHAPAEHTVDGKQYPMELHIVHGNAWGDLTVVGVFLRRGTNPNHLVDEIMENAPLNPVRQPIAHENINVAGLLPPNRASFFTYTGSLTTPPCTEGVRWYVLTDPIVVSNEAIEKFHTIISQFPNYNGYANNNRPVAPLNGRTIFKRQP